MKITLAKVAVFSLPLVMFSCGGNSVEGPKALDNASMDLTVKPGNDFFQYAGGTWLDKTPIPDDKTSYGEFDLVYEKSISDVRTILDKAAANADKALKGSVDQKMGYLYASGLDTITIDKKGFDPIKPLFEKINGLKNMPELLTYLVEQHLVGGDAMFSAGVEQDLMNSKVYRIYLGQSGLGLPDRDYYLEKDARSENIRAEYLKFMQKMLEKVGESPEVAGASTKSIMSIETELAKISNTRLENRNIQAMYNPMAIADLCKKYPNFLFDKYFTKMGVNTNDPIIVAHPKFFAGLNTLIAKISLNDWKTYLKWNAINANAGLLSSDFVAENFAFYGTVLSGQKTNSPRWKRISGAANNYLGEAVGQLYVKQFFPPEAKQKMILLVENLRKAFENRLAKNDWMTDSTKAKAIEKLKGITVKVGYPDKWKDYSLLAISKDNYFENIMNARAFLVKENLDKLGKPVDPTEWGMTPQTVNAYYNPLNNEIVFPAAILQHPFFDLNADDAVNYGAIGMVIAHEMTHGFDDQGRHFNKDGNMIDWWSPKDAENFKAKTQVLVNQFSRFVAVDSLHVNGELTLGENIADNGGLLISYDAYQLSLNGKQADKIDGFTGDQRFFLGYAQVWRQNTRKEALMSQVKEDVHSPARFRVNGGLANIAKFYEAFDVKAGDALYIAPENRTNIW
ncbi:M13 family metallopeptidase [Williamwhitmania taraxaci]|uniref:Putative endopeptidase n=1 Tax=Williamwhitmania taraxaci TaxID=1640674 RepID=A0A1G6ND19_9BACT|nr:M13 family metallopeptidase [Williamwhitmania taraxaci]SDC65730.1 putative endopeptidase [Williamwhitmania taraxaci]